MAISELGSAGEERGMDLASQINLPFHDKFNHLRTQIKIIPYNFVTSA